MSSASPARRRLRRGVAAWLLGLTLGTPAALAAQEALPVVIDHLELRRQGVFDSTEAARSWLARAANSLHILTRRSTIERELLLRAHRPYDSLLAFETVQNLRNLGVFRRVRIDSVRTDSGLVARVTTQDSWSTSASLRLRGSGEQTDYQVALDEYNLFGTATRVGARYRKTPDRTLTTLQLARKRIIAQRIGGELRLENRSDGERQLAVLSQPLFSVRSRFGFELRAERSDERVFRFREGRFVAADTLWRRYRLGRADVVTALRAEGGNYVRLGFTALVRRDDYADVEDGPFGNDVIATMGPYVEWRSADFFSTPRFLGLGRDEELVDLGTTVRVGILAAPTPFGYARGGTGGFISAHRGLRTPRGFAMLDLNANGLFTGAGLDSGSVFLAATVAVRAREDHLLLLHGQAGWIKDPRPGTEFDYGLSLGPRAYRTHAFTGDRAQFVTAEYRVVMPSAVAGLANVGLAVFGDYGGAWFDGSPSRYGASVGAGLRWGLNRGAGLSPSRIDLAYRTPTDVLKGGWVLSFGRGLTIYTGAR